MTARAALVVLAIAGYLAGTAQVHASSHVLPIVASVEVSLPAAQFVPPANLVCRVRTDQDLPDVAATGVCYGSLGAGVPSLPIPVLVPYDPLELTGTFSSSTGQLLLPVFDCVELVEDSFALEITLDMDVKGDLGTGSVEVVEDWSNPLNCDPSGGGASAFSGEAALSSLTTTHDTDGDGCPDYDELGATQGQGGLRDPLNPYDYMNPTHDGRNRVDDILKVVNQYFDDDNDGTPGLPPYVPGYNPDTDRTFLGPNAWNLGPPNGQQRVDDILNAIKQYFHDCS